MPTRSIEERLATVENELSQLKKQLADRQPIGEQTPGWQEWFGAFRDDRTFDSAMERGAEYRRSQPIEGQLDQ